jgi:hypothetical protein
MTEELDRFYLVPQIELASVLLDEGKKSLSSSCLQEDGCLGEFVAWSAGKTLAIGTVSQRRAQKCRPCNSGSLF